MRSKNWGRRRGFLVQGVGKHQIAGYHRSSPPEHPGTSSTSHPHPDPSLGPSHALCPLLLTPTYPSANMAAFSFPSDLQVPVNKVLQRRPLLRSRLPTPYPAKSGTRLSLGSIGRPRRAPIPSYWALPSAFQVHWARESSLQVGAPQLLGRAPP